MCRVVLFVFRGGSTLCSSPRALSAEHRLGDSAVCHRSTMRLKSTETTLDVVVPHLGSAALATQIEAHYEQRFTWILTMSLRKGDVEVGSINALLIGKQAMGSQFHAEMKWVRSRFKLTALTSDLQHTLTRSARVQ